MTWTFALFSDWLAVLGVIALCGAGGCWVTTRMLAKAADPERYEGTPETRAFLVKQNSRSIRWSRRVIVSLSLLLLIWSGRETLIHFARLELPGDGTARLHYLTGTVTLELRDLQRGELLVQEFSKRTNLRVRLVGSDGRVHTSLTARRDATAHEAYGWILEQSSVRPTLVKSRGLFGAESVSKAERAPASSSSAASASR